MDMAAWRPGYSLRLCVANGSSSFWISFAEICHIIHEQSSLSAYHVDRQLGRNRSSGSTLVGEKANKWIWKRKLLAQIKSIHDLFLALAAETSYQFFGRTTGSLNFTMAKTNKQTNKHSPLHTPTPLLVGAVSLAQKGVRSWSVHSSLLLAYTIHTKK